MGAGGKEEDKAAQGRETGHGATVSREREQEAKGGGGVGKEGKGNEMASKDATHAVPGIFRISLAGGGEIQDQEREQGGFNGSACCCSSAGLDLRRGGRR